MTQQFHLVIYLIIENMSTKRHTQVFIGAVFIITEKWKQLECPSTSEWIIKMWYIHTIEYYSASKKNRLLTHATKWINFENIILNKRSQSCII